MAETTINLGCAKINIKRDTHYYAPWDVINPRILNPIPQDAKTYKLTPTTTLFFKYRRSNLNFGLRHIKTKTKGKNMSYNYMSKGDSKNISKSTPKNVNFSDRERAAVACTLHKSFYAIKKETRLALLHENRTARKAMSFWQKVRVILVEADHDISFFFENDRRREWCGFNSYSTLTPGDKLTASFLKQNEKNKTNKTKRSNAKKSNEKMICIKESSFRSKLASFFQPKNSKQNALTIAHTQVVLPSAPPAQQPSSNPEYQAGTTINNYNITVCSIL